MKTQIYKRTTWALAVSLTLLATPAPPARAFSLTNPLDGLLQQLQKQWEAIQESFNQSIEESVAGITKDLNSDISAVTGQLGLPDILQSRKEIENAKSNDGLFNETLKANEIDRLAARVSSAMTLSQKGQEAAAQNLTQNQQTVEMTAQQASAAQEEVVTQNVMKRIALQNQLTSSVLGDIRAGQIRQQQSADLANANLANISAAQDGQRQKQDYEAMGAVGDLLRTSSMVGLY